MAQVIVAAIRKRKLTLLEDPSQLCQSETVDDEGEELEKRSNDDDVQGVDSENFLTLGWTSLAGGEEAPIIGTAVSFGGINSDLKADLLEESNVTNAADLSSGEKRDEDLDVRNDVAGSLVCDKKKDAEDAMAVGHHRGELENKVIIQLDHTDQFRCFDKAAIEVARDSQVNSYGRDGQVLKARRNPWRLCSVQQVEELKCMVRLVPMGGTLIPMAMALSGQTYAIVQAATMDRHFGKFVIPAASFSIFSTITVLIWLPFYDRIVMPLVRRWTGKERGITFLQKIGVGLVLSILAYVVTTLVERKRRMAARHYGFVDKPHDTIPISAFWLLPQHIMSGLSESFVVVGYMEFFYHMLPEHLTTTGSALFLTVLAIGTFFNALLLQVVQKVTTRHGHPGWLNNNINRAHLDYFYGLLTCFIALDFLFFLVVARWYNRQRHLNHLLLH